MISGTTSRLYQKKNSKNSFYRQEPCKFSAKSNDCDGNNKNFEGNSHESSVQNSMTQFAQRSTQEHPKSSKFSKSNRPSSPHELNSCSWKGPSAGEGKPLSRSRGDSIASAGEDKPFSRSRSNSIPSASMLPGYRSNSIPSTSVQGPRSNSMDSFRGPTDFNLFKSAGIIPYTQHNGVTMFLLQKIVKGTDNKNAFGWNDFGGKKSKTDANIFETAAREFGEETSCLFYLSEENLDQSYSCLKNEALTVFPEPQNGNSEAHTELRSSRDTLFPGAALLGNSEYSPQQVELLNSVIPANTQFFAERLNIGANYKQPLYASHKDVYVTFLMKVKYVPVEDIPTSEDLHVYYEERFVRECKWFTFTELMQLGRSDLHRRLQITPLHDRIMYYYKESLLN
jgi:hypothetical protein